MSDTDKPPRAANLKAPPIYKVIVIQFLTSVVAALGCFLVLDTIAAYSVLLGGLICTLPNGYFARKAFQYRGARYAPQIVKSFYVGEAGKLVMTAVMFALVFAGVRPLNEGAVIAGFVLAMVVGLIATALVGLKPR